MEANEVRYWITRNDERRLRTASRECQRFARTKIHTVEMNRVAKISQNLRAEVVFTHACATRNHEQVTRLIRLHTEISRIVAATALSKRSHSLTCEQRCKQRRVRISNLPASWFRLRRN